MMSVSSLDLLWNVGARAARDVDSLRFDLSDPKILLGLFIGGMLPYLLPGILAALVKWLLFVVILGTGPRPLTLLAVTLGELACVLLAMCVTFQLGIPPRLSIAVYPLLATFPNLLLFRAVNHRYADSLMKKFLCAFAAAMLYPLCFVPVFLLLAVWWGTL